MENKEIADVERVPFVHACDAFFPNSTLDPLQLFYREDRGLWPDQAFDTAFVFPAIPIAMAKPMRQISQQRALVYPVRVRGLIRDKVFSPVHLIVKKHPVHLKILFDIVPILMCCWFSPVSEVAKLRYFVSYVCNDLEKEFRSLKDR